MDLNSDLFQQLAQFAMGPVTKKTSDLDMAKQILLNSSVNTSHVWDIPNFTAPSDKGKKKGGPSTFSRVIDILQRPEYAVTEWAKELVKPHKLDIGPLHVGYGNPDEASSNPIAPAVKAWGGFSGKKKSLPSDVFREAGLMPKNAPGALATGLVYDIALDPLTYLGPGLVKGVMKGIKGVTDLSKTKAVLDLAPEATQAAKATDKTVHTTESVKTRPAFQQYGPLTIGNEDVVSHVITALKDAPAVSTALDQTVKTAGVAEHALSPMQAALTTEDAIKEGRQVLKAADASSGAVSTFSKTMRDVLYTNRTTPQNTILRNSEPIALKMLPKGAKNPTTGRFVPRSLPSWPKVVEQTTHALNGVLDEPIRVLKPGETVSQKGVSDGIMSRVATWWGQKDLRPLALDAITSARASSEKRIEALTHLFKPYSDEQIMQAWDVATKIRPTTITNPEVVKLADQLTGSMENWFKSSAIPDKAAKGNSVALRAGITIEDMNKALARYGVDFKFTDAADAATKGGTRTRDFSNGTDWLNSWEGHIPQSANDLKKAIYGIQSAAEQLTREYGFLDDVASRFGSPVKQKGWVAVDNPRLEGFYFPPEIGDQLSRAIKTYHDMYIPGSATAKFVASGTSAWKSGVTKYHPRHHIANIIGDTFLAWMAGVNNPIVFKKAAQVMFSQKGHYKDLAGVEDLVKPGAIADAMTKPGKIITRNKKMAFTADQIYIAAHNYGLLQKASAIEDIVRPGLVKNIKPFGGKVSHAASATAETREHFVKLAHFIDAISKSKGASYKEVFEKAAHEVRKWHPDGLDLTKEEQKLRTLGVPFYSWLRKSTPLLIEGAVMNPKKAFSIPQHAQYNLQKAVGINPSSPSDPFPADQMFPAWIQEKGIGPLGLTGATGLAGLLGGAARQGVDDEGKPIGGYALAGPSNPMQDLFGSFGGFSPEGTIRGLAGAINPLARVPAEIAFGQRVFSGVPISDKSDYATEQIPFASQFSRMTNITPFGTSSRGDKEGIGSQEGTLNWLFNAGIVGTGPYIKSAEFEDIPRQAEQNKKYREFAKQIGQPLNSKGKIPQWIKDLYNQQGGNK